MAIPSRMNQVQLTAYGAPETLRVAEAPVPMPQAGEALLKVVAAGVNYADAELLRLRTTLGKAIDPLRSPGADLQGILLRCNRLAAGEVASMETQP